MIASALPDNAGYVAAAYLVFLALLLIYFGIMAYKMVRIQRDVAELAERSPRGRGSERELAQGLARTAGDAHEDLARTAGDAHE
jgi:hypothetical protein